MTTEKQRPLSELTKRVSDLDVLRRQADAYIEKARRGVAAPQLQWVSSYGQPAGADPKKLKAAQDVADTMMRLEAKAEALGHIRVARAAAAELRRDLVALAAKVHTDLGQLEGELLEAAASFESPIQ